MVQSDPVTDTYRPVDPSIAVEVEHEGTWYPGVLTVWHRRDDGWHGSVSCTVEPGMTYLWIVPAARLRPVSEGGDTMAEPSR